MKIAIVALIYGAQALRLSDSYDTNLDEQIQDRRYFANKARQQHQSGKLMPDGLYHLANGKAIDAQGNEVDTSDISEIGLSDEHYHLQNGQVQDTDGDALKFMVQTKDSYDDEVSNDEVVAELRKKKAEQQRSLPKMMPDGLYHLANGKIVDKAGKEVDQSDIDMVQTHDWYDEDFDRMTMVQKQKRQEKKVLKNVMPDGLVHVV